MYLSPPPFELVGSETVAKFANTTAAPAVTLADSPLAEQANYYDLGVQQKFTPSSRWASTPTTSNRTT